MTAFPSSSSDIVTTNLDSASDKPKDARQDLFNALTKLKTVIDSFDANSGICGLNSSGKVDSAKLTGQVIKASLGADAVDGTKIEDDSIDSEHIVDGAVDHQHISFASTDITMGGNSPSNSLVPTQGAVNGFIGQLAVVDFIFGAELSCSVNGSGYGTGTIQANNTIASNIHYLRQGSKTGGFTAGSLVTSEVSAFLNGATYNTVIGGTTMKNTSGGTMLFESISLEQVTTQAHFGDNHRQSTIFCLVKVASDDSLTLLAHISGYGVATDPYGNHKTIFGHEKSGTNFTLANNESLAVLACQGNSANTSDVSMTVDAQAFGATRPNFKRWDSTGYTQLACSCKVSMNRGYISY